MTAYYGILDALYSVAVILLGGLAFGLILHGLAKSNARIDRDEIERNERGS